MAAAQTSPGTGRAGSGTGRLLAGIGEAPGRVETALQAADFRAALAAIWPIVDQANSCIESAAPWQLARAARAGDTAAAARLDEILALLLSACRALGGELSPFVPGLASRISTACRPGAGNTSVFPRLRPR